MTDEKEASTCAPGKVLVVVNPSSGNGRALSLLAGVEAGVSAVRALAARSEAGDSTTWPVVKTTKDGAWKSEAEVFLKRGFRNVMVIGGDGTLMEVAALLYGLSKSLNGKLQIVPVPGGRGNDFVRGLCGYSGDGGEFWTWAGGRIEKERHCWSRRALDLASANGRIFLNMASLGFGGRVVENAQRRKAFWSKSSLVYQVEGAIELLSGGDCSCDVKVDGQSVYTGPFFGAFVGNGKANGAGLYWAREARIDDGVLDAIVFPKPAIAEMLRTMGAVKSTAEPPPPLPFRHRIFRGEEIVFHFDSPTALELDGDFSCNARSHGIKCLPHALDLWMLKK